MKRITIKAAISNEEADNIALRLGDILPVHEIDVEDVTYYVHKVTIRQEFGGHEEGGWWYDAKYPIDEESDDHMHPVPFETEDAAEEFCRRLNQAEYERREDLDNRYSSVLSYRETFYSYTITESPVFQPTPRPHYE